MSLPAHPLIAASDLMARLARHETIVLLDCGFDLADPSRGETLYRQAHLPGAHYANLDRDLSGTKTGRNGRHPLPERATFARTVARWSIQPGVAVVAYDAQSGPYAARAWWMLRWLGHADVAVLDGGSAAWQQAGGAMEQAVPAADTAAAPYPMAAEPAMPMVDAMRLAQRLGVDLLIDARAAERHRGEVEPLDPVAGHIPGALNRPFGRNLDAQGRFLPAAELRAAFTALGAGTQPVVHACGSGVTACHNLLAMEAAGLHGSLLYPGSWSEWCADPARPVARG
jgi:thiosulfate/3-mercaptopyruvate sulfurtransferase